MENSAEDSNENIETNQALKRGRPKLDGNEKDKGLKQLLCIRYVKYDMFTISK